MYFGPALRTQQQYQLPSGYPTAPPEPAGSDVASILATLLRRKRVFLAIFIGFFSLVVLLTLLSPKSYTATTELIAGTSGSGSPGKGDTTLPLLNALLGGSSMSPETYVALIQEDPVVAQVVDNLHLNLDASSLRNHISVKPVNNTSIIRLSATWGDPETAARIANEFASVFVNRERELIAGNAGSAMDFLTKQMPVAEAAMHKVDGDLAQFESAHPNVYINIGGQNPSTDSAVLAAQQRFAQTQVDAGQAQAQLANVTSQLSSTAATINGSSSIVVNPVTSQLQTQLAQVEVQLEDARRQYTDQHPTVVALKEQKDQLEREIRNQAPTIVSGNNIVPNPIYQQLNAQAANLRSQIAGDQAQMKNLRAELGQMNGALNSLPVLTMELASLERKAKLAEDVYSALQEKYSEATVAKTTALSDVAITSPAFAGGAEVRPNVMLNLLLGIALAFVSAISGVFIVDFFDNTIKNEEDVQRALPLPLLTTVPHLVTNSPRKLPWLRALTVESFLQLVTALKYSSDKPLRTLAITSPNQGDGKTTVALSTAIAMAQIEPKVILIDADFRRPTLHQLLGVPAEPGLSEVLVGEMALKDAIQPTKYDGLSLLSGGARVPNPAKLIHSPRLDELVAELLKEYRAVVFDTPPLLAVYDATILATKVDGTVFVVSAGTTDLPSTKKALQRLSTVQDVNMLGVVLNRAAPTNGYEAYYLSTDSATPLPHENGVVSES